MTTKSLLLALPIAALLTSCSSDEPQLKAPIQNQELSSKLRTSVEAADAALDAFNRLYPAKSRSQISVANVRMIPALNSRSSSDNGVYIVNFEDSAGYAIIACNKQTDPILAVIEDGNYDESTALPEVNEFIRAAQRYQEKIVTPTPIDTLQPPKQFHSEDIDTIINVKIEPKLKTWWGQSGFYAMYTPLFEGQHSPVGCAAVAVGMCMSYTKYDRPIPITFDGRNETLTLNWDNILKHEYLKSNCEPGSQWTGGALCWADDESHVAIAKLLRQIGHIAQTTYEKDKSGTSDLNLVKTLDSLQITNTGLKDYTYAFSILPEDKIIIATASGHAFVIDGADAFKWIEYENIYDVIFGTKILVERRVSYTYTSILAHVVWGWDNKGVGYYEDRVFNTMDWKSLDLKAVEMNSENAGCFNADLRYVAIDNFVKTLL